jgi:CBS domain-containing protein
MGIANVLRRRKIRQLALPKFLSVDVNSSLAETVRAMQSAKVGAVLVTENQRLAGIFTERDLITKVAGVTVDRVKPIREFMTPEPATLHPEDSVFDAIQLMDERGYRNIPLVDQRGQLAGNLPVSTLINFLAESFPQEVLALPPRANQLFTAADGA